MNAITSPQASQRGLAIVEFTIVLPLLLLLMLAAAEFGRALYQYDTLTKAVRDGARYYSDSQFLYIGTSKKVDLAAAPAATNLVVYGNSTGAGQPLVPGLTTGMVFLIPPPTPPAPTGDYVTVRVNYPFTFLPGNPLAGILSLFGGNGLGNLTMTASIVMRVI